MGTAVSEAIDEQPRLGIIAGMSKALLNRHRMPQRFAWLAALVLCFGQADADTHLHLDEFEEDVCTLCGFSDPGHVQDVGSADSQPRAWRRTNSVPVFSAILSPRPFEVSRSRAPPIS